MKAFACTLVLVFLALPLCAAAAATTSKKTVTTTVTTAGKAAVKRDRSTGEETTTAPAEKAAGPTACKLTLSPNTATNGKTFSFSVSYTPCLNQARTETFTFPWASNNANFTEVTVRQKIFKTASGCTSSSFDNTIVPTALAIKGKFDAKVEVKDTGGTVICTATAPMTVN